MKNRFGFDWQNIPGTHFWKGPQLSRRIFFRHTASAVGGYFLMPTRPMETVAKAAVTPIGTAKNCIFILLAGGPSHVDTFDLKEGAWLNQATVPGNATRVADLLQPTAYGDVAWPQGLMPKLAEQLDSIALVRSVRSWAAVHELARTWMQIGRNPTSGLSKIAPHIGSVVSLELSNTRQQTLPAFVSLNTGGGPGSGYLPSNHAPFYVSPGGNGLANATHRDGQPAFERRRSLLGLLDDEGQDSSRAGYGDQSAFFEGAQRLMYNDAVMKAFTFDQAARTQYGATGFGNACLAARNLLRGNLGPRFIQITLGSWDHHQNIYLPNAGLQNMTRQLDNGLGALMADLKTDGLLDETLIVAMGEFGRTVNNVNSQNGRDHFLQQAVLLAGARIRGRQAIGSTDAEGRAIVDPGWSRKREIRAEDIEATIYSAMGIDWTKIRRDDPLGRGFEYVPFSEQDLYGPITELWN